MFLSSRLLCVLTVAGLAITCVSAADAPKDNPLGQAGTTAGPTGNVNDLEFAGVTTIGNKTTITLYDKAQKSNLWVEVGKTVGDITVVKYDSDHDQVTVRRNGVEKDLPLRPPSAVAAGNAAPIPPAATPAMSAATPATTTSTTSLSQARQEEEARMLVSDLLEIGMAQRKAYEEAQRRASAAQGQAQTAPTPPAGSPTGAQTAPAQPAESQPSQSASSATASPSGS